MRRARPDRRTRIFWCHPRLMDYRVPLFEKMSEQFDVRFFFQQTSHVPHSFPSVYGRDDVIRSEGLPSEDARAIREGVRWSDVFVSSFVMSSYTRSGIVAAKLLGRKTIVWEEIGDRTLQDVEPRDPRYGWRGLRRAFGSGGPDARRAFRTVNTFRLLAKLVDAFFVQGELQAEALVRLGVARRRIFRSNEYPGYRYSEVTPSPFPLPIDPAARVVLFLGRLIEIKGVEYAIRAFARLSPGFSDAALLVVGDGPERSRLEGLARELGLASVHFLGAIDDVGRKSFLFSRASAVVVPSIRLPRQREGGPLVVLEAMSAGTPVVGTDALGASTPLIRAGVNGFVVPEKDSEALARALERALAPGTFARGSVLRSFAEIPSHEDQVDQLTRAVAFVSGQP